MALRADGLWVEETGAGEPVLLLMHGLSGTGAVWNGLRRILAREWPGRVIVPDLRGHGRSAHAPAYGIALHAADMVRLVEGAGRVYLAGHSMGGACGMVLASGWFGFVPEAVVTVGVAVDWTEALWARLMRLVDTPVRWFDSRAEALERFVLVNGLNGIVDPASEVAATGVVEDGGKWRLAADNRAAMVATAATRRIHAAAVAPIVLAAGETDTMARHAEHLSLDPGAPLLPGLGHNAHVEDPAAFWALIRRAAGL